MNLEELQIELWNIDARYHRHFIDNNHYELVPIMQILILIAKILLYRTVQGR